MCLLCFQVVQKSTEIDNEVQTNDLNSSFDENLLEIAAETSRHATCQTLPQQMDDSGVDDAEDHSHQQGITNEIVLLL